MESLFLETDSPVLRPDPKTRNEPENLLVAAQAIADIKGESLERTLYVIKENTSRLYGDQLLGSRGTSKELRLE